MRKTIFGISIFLLFPVFLSAAVFPGQLPPTVRTWAALKDGGAPFEEEVKTAMAGQLPQGQAPALHEKNTLLPLLLQGKPLRVIITVPPAEEGRPEFLRYYQTLLGNAFDQWFLNLSGAIRHYCKKTGDCKTFQDVRLPRVTLRLAAENDPADLKISVLDNLATLQYLCRRDDCHGTVVPGNAHGPLEVMVYKQAPDNVWYHEIGHVLGLADMYPEGFETMASATVRSKEQDKSQSVMSYLGGHFGCEDADGLLNLIDRWTLYFALYTYGKDYKAHISHRLLNGWNSFCPRQEHYTPLSSLTEE